MEKYIHAFWSVDSNSYNCLSLINRCFKGDFRFAWNEATKRQLYLAVKKRDYLQKLFAARLRFDVDKEFEKLKSLKITPMSRLNPEYPQELLRIEAPPFLLYRKGSSLQKMANRVAIVGSRKSTLVRQQLAFGLAKTLASNDQTIVSGLAFGIDAAAHRGTLSAEGKTIAVLASGLSQVTPASHHDLATQIINQGGAIISEYPFSMPAFKYQYLARNRIISGLSKVVIVVEAGEKSGALITAGHAAIQSREVLAFPGDPGNKYSAGCNSLIKTGAHLVDSISDVIKFLKINDNLSIIDAIQKAVNLSVEERAIMNLLSEGCKSTEELASALKLEITQIYESLGNLEINGLISKSSSLKWQKALIK